MPDTATLQQWLSEAELARHQLMTSQLPVRVRFGEHDVQMIEQSNLAQLDGYIADLKRQLGLETRTRRPIRPLFGS